MNDIQLLTKLSGRTVFDVCVEQCKGTQVEPARLARLIADDPGWWNPIAVKRWVKLIEEKGWPEG